VVQEIYLSPKEQYEKWKDLNEWIKKGFPNEAISDLAFKEGEALLPGLTSQDRLFFGFGDDGQGNADPFFTGHVFVTYLEKKYPHELSPFLNFYPPPPDPMRFDFYRPKIKLRDGAAVRPKGFYVKRLLEKDYTDGVGAEHKALSPADVRKRSDWGWGPEGFTFLALEEKYTKLLLAGKVPIFVLGDYAVSPYGTSDYFSAFLLGPCRGKLELGVTNVRDNIPKFAPSHFA
jgi:hypothetical protein